jgi:hypothetical protein
MTKGLFTRFALIAAISALALVFTSDASFAAKKKAAKKKEAPTAQAGRCTSYCNAFKWCHVRWKTSGGGAVPTVFMCAEGNCPPKC